MNKWYNPLFTFAVYLFVSLLFLQGCGSSGFMLRSSTDQLFTPSNITVSEVYDLQARFQARVNYFSALLGRVKGLVLSTL